MSGKFWNFSWLIKRAGWNHSKAIIITMIVNFCYRFQTSSMHILLEVDHEKNALCHARASSFSRSTSKRELIRPNFSIPRVLLLLARSRARARQLAIFYQTPFAIQRASSRAIFLFQTPHQQGEHLIALFFKKKYTKINRCLPGKVSIFGSEQESFAPRLRQNNATRLCAHAQGDSRWQSRSPRKSKKWKILCSVAFSNSFMLCFG